MKGSRPPFTRADVVVMVILLCIIVAPMFFLPWLARSREHARLSRCRENLQEVSKAMAAYREDNGGYFPFSWQRAGELEPEGNGAANGAMAATSLGNLHRRYIQDSMLFRCPSTEDMPWFVPNLPAEFRTTNRAIGNPYPLPAASNWTLTGNLPLNPRDPKSTGIRASSYGYDPRISPRAPGRHAVAGDMDGSYQLSDYTETQNHEGGQNVLFVDGSVRWIQGSEYTANYCSNDPNDNIFAEDKWDADTDSYLVDTDAALSVSFDGYEHLHYPRKAQPATR